MPTDIEPIYISEKEAALLLGRSLNWFNKNRSDLEKQFRFPKVDPAIGKRHRPTIEAWAQERNTRLTRQEGGPIERRETVKIGNINEF